MKQILELVPPDEAQTIGRRIKAARGHRSQQQLADAVGISVRTLRNWEADTHSPTVQGVKRIAKCTGWPVTYLIGADIDDNPDPDGDDRWAPWDSNPRPMEQKCDEQQLTFTLAA
jgi:transcriptional regulator with XRE-family HTH domain